MEDLKRTHSFINDYWKFIKRFYVPDTDANSQYWHDFIEEADALVRKYGNGKFEKAVVLAFMDYTEAKAHEGQTNYKQR